MEQIKTIIDWAVCKICLMPILPEQQWVYPEKSSDEFIHALHFGKPINTREEYLELNKKETEDIEKHYDGLWCKPDE